MTEMSISGRKTMPSNRNSVGSSAGSAFAPDKGSADQNERFIDLNSRESSSNSLVDGFFPSALPESACFGKTVSESDSCACMLASVRRNNNNNNNNSSSSTIIYKRRSRNISCFGDFSFIVVTILFFCFRPNCVLGQRSEVPRMDHSHLGE